MAYRLFFTSKAERQLAKLDRAVQIRIRNYLDRYVDGCTDPRANGKALAGNLKGAWRYRVGDYRIVCEIRDDELVVVAIGIGDRKNVYEGLK